VARGERGFKRSVFWFRFPIVGSVGTHISNV